MQRLSPAYTDPGRLLAARRACTSVRSMTSRRPVRDRPGSVRIARRAWVAAESADDLLERCAQVLRSSPPDTYVVGPTAARLHALWLPSTFDERIWVATATPGQSHEQMTRTQRPELAVRRLVLRPDERTVVDGVPVTSPARTWRDLAVHLDFASLVAAGDSVLRGGTSRGEIAEVVARGFHVRGIRNARMAAKLLDGRSRSRPESHLRVAVSSLGLAFGVNEPVFRTTGGWLAEPDLSLTAARLALEYQGLDHANPDRMRRDMTRFADLRGDGWLVFTYGPAEVFRRPWTIAAEVRAAVRERAPGLRVR